MNKKEVITKVSEKSGVNAKDCSKVLDAFEKVFSDGVLESKSKIFNILYKIMELIANNKKDTQN